MLLFFYISIIADLIVRVKGVCRNFIKFIFVCPLADGQKMWYDRAYLTIGRDA